MTNLVRRALPIAPVVLLLLATLVLGACGKSDAEGPPGGAGGPQGGPPVSVAPVTQRSIQEFDEYSARIEATELVDVRSRVGGTLDKAHFREGQKVAKGDLLFTIDPRPFAAETARLQAQLNTAQTQAELSKSELVRAEKLLPMQAISLQEVDQLRAAARS
jgi:RND family efflux transporter MFP subunit